MNPEAAADPPGDPAQEAPTATARPASGWFGPDAASRRRPPIVLLAGMLGDEAVWGAVADRLVDAARPWPIRIDLDDSVTELAESVLAAAPPRFALAGHSLGGIVALEVVRRAPERVIALALVCSSGRAPTDGQLATWQGWRERTEAGDFAALADHLATTTLGPAARSEARLVRLNRSMAERVGPTGFLRQLRAQASRTDARPHLDTVTVPTLVVSAEQDDVCPPELQAELVAGLPNAVAATVPGGHLAPLESPDELAALLAGWLARVDGRQ